MSLFDNAKHKISLGFYLRSIKEIRRDLDSAVYMCASYVPEAMDNLERSRTYLEDALAMISEEYGSL